MLHTVWRASRQPVLAVITLLASAGPSAAVHAGPPPIVIASTTSVDQSGLFNHIVPKFTATTGIGVRVLGQGTGQALETGRRGDADLVFVHAPEAETRFVEEGAGVERVRVMSNDFILVGPGSDPLSLRERPDILTAFTAIAAAGAPFISRGDDSGTHQAERGLWRQAEIEPSGVWYRDVGAGMGPALTVAVQMQAHILVDSATWYSFGDRQGLDILVAGDERLTNPYSVILVSPDRHDHVAAEAGQTFIDWLVSTEGQAAIASHVVEGRQLFRPDADRQE